MEKIREEEFNFAGNNYKIVVYKTEKGFDIVGKHEGKIVSSKFSASHIKLDGNNQLSTINAIDCLIEAVKSDIEKLSMNLIRREEI